TADTKVELDEDFTFSQSGVVNAGRSVTTGTNGTGTIVNDDTAQFNVESNSGNEDDGAITFTVTLTNEVDADVSVNVSTVDGTAKTSDSDYTAVVNHTVTFLAGDTRKRRTSALTADTKVELDEDFTF